MKFNFLKSPHWHCKECGKDFVRDAHSLYPWMLCEECGRDYILRAIKDKKEREG